ncbi:hlh transcription factor [Colletotrichum truncatum]|uniref:Hlh transcription factor n=1 Tax=Colletotrichum truncatum TaxID=5467 RepID=A0ACC3YWZ2_COLTU|nr:hlh transcription factor [Colletotrichum truncatum]KAF6792583.1 hlh transcription factor [Colletotrichum truncatum]
MVLTKHSLRRAATRASLASAISTATTAAPKTQPITFALRSANVGRCFSAAATRAFSRSVVLRDEQQQTQRPQQPQEGEAPAASEQQSVEVPPPSQFCIFVQNYPFNVPRDDLAEAFSKFGEVVHIDMPPRKTFCFVYYKHADSVSQAIENVDGTFWHGRRIAVKESTPKSRIYTPNQRRDSRNRTGSTARANSKAYDGPPTNTIFVGNLSFDATDVDLNQLFSILKDVKDVRVAVDKSTGWPRGFAHAEFHSPEAAQAGIDALQGQSLRGRQVKVQFAPEMRNRRPRGQDTQQEVEAAAVQEQEQKKNQTMDWNA